MIETTIKCDGGKAWVEPAENGGACFRVFLADPVDDATTPLPSAA